MSKDDKIKKQVEEDYFSRLKDEKKALYEKCYYGKFSILTEQEKKIRKKIQSNISHHVLYRDPKFRERKGRLKNQKKVREKLERLKKQKKSYIVIDYSINNMKLSLTPSPTEKILSYSEIQKELINREWR